MTLNRRLKVILLASLLASFGGWINFTTSDVGSLLGLCIASAGGFIAMGAIFRLPPHTATYLLGCAFFGTGLIGARFRIACRLYISQHCPDTIASAGATLQSYTMLTQFIAPCGGALLAAFLSTSTVFFVLGATAVVLLSAGSLYFRSLSYSSATFAEGSESAARLDSRSSIQRHGLPAQR